MWFGRRFPSSALYLALAERLGCVNIVHGAWSPTVPVSSVPRWSQLPWSNGSPPKELGVHKGIHSLFLKVIPKPTLATLPQPHSQSAPNLALVHPGLVRYSQTIENRIHSHTGGQKIFFENET